ncbi:diacylglycerol kinase family protein [Agreia sp. COWG]|uniref:diacylglycerol/lipid kinase family protein n=1 Tax=Agreia sp. COWG TaxID=2773266 RepID=UPI0019287A99|nr:diacylglycerol kinase family protein [Agreia sp. COWG]CAD5990316.1 Diacylglycerol kinase [Agreia sp. COWG]
MATSEVPAQPQKAAVVYNPLKVDVTKLRLEIERAAARAGYESTLWFETTAEEAGQALTRQAVEQGATVVIAAGGDGTVRAVAEGLRHTDASLGLLPSGTGNLLARNLDMGVSNRDTAIGIVFSGRDRVIDLGLAAITRRDGVTEEHVFLVMAGLGLDAKMIANTSSKLKKAVGWLAYVDGMGRSLPELHPVKFRFSIDDAAWRATSAHTVMVGNCGLLPGGVLLIPDAKLDDGVLDIMALRPSGPFGWLKVWNKIAWENGVLRKSAAGRKIIDLSRDVRSVTYRTGTDLKLVVDEPEEFQLDGDEFGEVTAVHSWVEPGALRVRVRA